MPAKPPTPCTSPGCTHTAPDGGRCPQCRTRRARSGDQARGNPAQRGYTTAWSRRRRHYLTANPTCVLCGHPATVADHHPVSRRQHVTNGDPDPDAAHHLRPLCDPCHRTETARLQPGGWHREQRRP